MLVTKNVVVVVQACFFNTFPPPCVPQIAEKLSLAKNSLSFPKKHLELGEIPQG